MPNFFDCTSLRYSKACAIHNTDTMAIQSPLPGSGIEVLVVTSIFLVFAILAVIARFYARSIQKKSFWADDYLIVAGLVSFFHTTPDT